jgi:hypothetical protein
MCCGGLDGGLRSGLGREVADADPVPHPLPSAEDEFELLYGQPEVDCGGLQFGLCPADEFGLLEEVGEVGSLPVSGDAADEGGEFVAGEIGAGLLVLFLVGLLGRRPGGGRGGPPGGHAPSDDGSGDGEPGEVWGVPAGVHGDVPPECERGVAFPPVEPFAEESPPAVDKDAGACIQGGPSPADGEDGAQFCGDTAVQAGGVLLPRLFNDLH